jgi:hypothetical protein
LHESSLGRSANPDLNVSLAVIAKADRIADPDLIVHHEVIDRSGLIAPIVDRVPTEQNGRNEVTVAIAVQVLNVVNGPTVLCVRKRV